MIEILLQDITMCNAYVLNTKHEVTYRTDVELQRYPITSPNYLHELIVNAAISFEAKWRLDLVTI